MMDNLKTDELTRHLKPIQDIQPTDFEILQSLIKADVDPEEISSVTRLRGSRSGVIRVRMKTRNSVDILDSLVKKRKINIGGVVLGTVPECGNFVKILLENVPMCITDSDVEEEMRKYGNVIKSEKQYLDYAGCRIANEKRTVLFSSIMKGTCLQNARIPICGSTVFSSIVSPSADHKQRLKQQMTVGEQAPAVKQQDVARRKSLGALQFYDDNTSNDLEDDWLIQLQSRRSFKVKQTEGQMSSVAYRQSTVVRDVEKSIRPGDYDILTSRDLKCHPQTPKVSTKTDNNERTRNSNKKWGDNEDEEEDRNKLSWLKSFDKRRNAKKSGLQVDKKSKNQDLKLKLEEKWEEIKRRQKPSTVVDSPKIINNNLKVPETKTQKKVNWISDKIPELKTLTSSNANKKPKSCNETFANFLELRKKQKRADAFEQLSAHLMW